MFRWIILATATLLSSQVHAGDKIKFDGICRLTSENGKQWSGVAISETQIISVWHHEETGEVFAEFSHESHGSKTRLRLPAQVRKLNRRADLSIIEFKAPDYIELKTYKVKHRKGKSVTIKGFVYNAATEVRDAILISDTDTSDGFRLYRFSKPGISGMSGSPAFEAEYVVGIQTAGTQQVLTVPGEIVIQFIEGKVGDER